MVKPGESVKKAIDDVDEHPDGRLLWDDLDDEIATKLVTSLDKKVEAHNVRLDVYWFFESLTFRSNF
jgi:hypothetical protein